MVSFTVMEKEQKLRALMQMMGLRLHWYWLAEWAWNSLLTLYTSLLFLIIGLGGEVSFMARSPGTVVLLVLLHAQSLVFLAMLASVFYRKTTLSFMVNSFLICVFAVTGTMLTIAEYTSKAFPTYYFLCAPLAYTRGIYLLTRWAARGAPSWAQLEMQNILGMLVADMIVYLFSALYLDAITPRQFGVSQPPLFFLRPLRRMLRGGSLDSQAPLSYADVDEHEDSDVSSERLLIQELVAGRGGSVAMGSASSAGRVPHSTTVGSTAESSSEELLLESYSLRKVYRAGWLRRSRGDKVAVRNLTLGIRSNECFGLLGPNGAGKSTAISMWTGLFAPTSGRASICGFDMETQMDEIYQRLGVCPQFDILWPLLTVEETLLFYAKLKGVPRHLLAQTVEACLKGVSLVTTKTRRIGRLSGGMQRRVSLAISLIGDPSIIFLDEPTTGLDPETKRNMWTLIGLAKPSRCIVLTTHSMEEADALCGRIGIMAYGSLRCLGTSLHLKHKFGDGDKLDFTCRPGEVEAGKACIRELIPNGQLQDAGTALEGGTQCTMRLPSGADADAVRLSELFRELDDKASDAGIIEWALRQPSMEEVFLKIARASEVELETRKQEETQKKHPRAFNV